VSEGQDNKQARPSVNGLAFQGETMGMDVYGRNPSEECGEYFRACIWSWAPLYEQVGLLCADLLDSEVLMSMAYNDGAGPDDQDTCSRMAERFESALAIHQDGFTLPAESVRVTEEGRVVSQEEIARNPTLKTYSPYKIRREHVQEWIRFLRHCGGFEVW
jgi:hypothetical protein